jgi:hypothetical protein
MTNWKGCGRKRSWPNLRYSPGIFLENRKITKKLSHDNRSPGRDLKPEHLKYEARVLTTRPPRSVQNSSFLAFKGLQFFCRSSVLQDPCTYYNVWKFHLPTKCKQPHFRFKVHHLNYTTCLFHYKPYAPLCGGTRRMRFKFRASLSDNTVGKKQNWYKRRVRT